MVGFEIGEVLSEIRFIGPKTKIREVIIFEILEEGFDIFVRGRGQAGKG